MSSFLTFNEPGFIEHHSQPDLLSSSPTMNKTVNWVTAGAVTSIKNQGQCGGCYGFSTAAAMEGAYYIKSGKLVDLSAQ